MRDTKTVGMAYLCWVAAGSVGLRVYLDMHRPVLFSLGLGFLGIVLLMAGASGESQGHGIVRIAGLVVVVLGMASLIGLTVVDLFRVPTLVEQANGAPTRAQMRRNAREAARYEAQRRAEMSVHLEATGIGQRARGDTHAADDDGGGDGVYMPPPTPEGHHDRLRRPDLV